MPAPLCLPVVARLRYVWTLSWCAIVSVVMFPPGAVHYLMRPTAERFWRWMRVWSRVVLGGCGFRVEASGTAYEGAAVIVANHEAMLDIPALLLGIDRPFVFVARSELRRLPIVGWVLALTRCVFIDRGAGGAGLAEAAQRVAEGDAVVFYPEGTRNYGETVRPFLTGAFRLALAADVPVIPVAVDGAPTILNERQKTARSGTVRVRVGAPLHALPGEDPRAFAARARSAVVALLAS